MLKKTKQNCASNLIMLCMQMSLRQKTTTRNGKFVGWRKLLVSACFVFTFVREKKLKLIYAGNHHIEGN